eukprot:1470067-Prymnesium_polylepis.1
MRRLSTPLVAPRAISSSRCSSSSAPRATTREPVSWYLRPTRAVGRGRSGEGGRASRCAFGARSVSVR